MKSHVKTDCPLTGPTSYIAPAAVPVIFSEEDGPDAEGDQNGRDAEEEDGPDVEGDFGFGAAAAQASPSPLDWSYFALFLGIKFCELCP